VRCSIRRVAEFSELLDFWFGAPSSPARGRNRKAWFTKDAAFDAEVRGRFLAPFEAALAGKLTRWAATPYGSLALVVLLDQFSRNMFRDSPRAFSADALALATARTTIARGFDCVLRPVERCFVYLPFEHSEELAVQRRSVALFESLAAYPECASAIDYARRHFEIVARFGRFPHRNECLGRVSTSEELEFLKQPGSRF
jgi:uncharacterized protein (DUF924 family)